MQYSRALSYILQSAGLLKEVAFQTSGNYGLKDLPCHKGSEAGEKATRLRGAGKGGQKTQAGSRKPTKTPSLSKQRCSERSLYSLT